MSKRTSLVCQHLENISREALEKDPTKEESLGVKELGGQTFKIRLNTKRCPP